MDPVSFFPLAIPLIPNCAIYLSRHRFPGVTKDIVDPERGLILYYFSLSLQFEFYMRQKYRTRHKVVSPFQMQILYKIYSRDVEMENIKCILVMQNYSKEYQTFSSRYFKSGSFLNRNQLLHFILCICFVNTTTKHSINKYVWTGCSLGKNECFLIYWLDHLNIQNTLCRCSGKAKTILDKPVCAMRSYG